MEISPFTIDVSPDVLDDLRARLRNTRWPEPETVDDWTQGIPLTYVREVCDYWADDYDWAARQALLNEWPQFTTRIDNQVPANPSTDGAASAPPASGPADRRTGDDPVDVHFIHAPSPNDDALPLLLTHGWPGSVVEFAKSIGPLTDPAAHGAPDAQAFHVVCPSLPGYGFSSKPTRPGWNVETIADAWRELMERLGYVSFGAQGGDWGSAVTTALGARHPDAVVGIHLNMVMRGQRPKDREPTDDEREALAKAAYYNDWDSGYSKQQSTRPQTLGYGLTDSPAGQAAWIIEKFWAWTDCEGHPENALSRDEMLDNVMLYWLNSNAASSGRLYWESFRQMSRFTVDVPTGVAVFPKEIIPPVRAWSEPVYTDIRRWTDMERGGHFAAFEQPELFIDDVRAFFGDLA